MPATAYSGRFAADARFRALASIGRKRQQPVPNDRPADRWLRRLIVMEPGGLIRKWELSQCPPELIDILGTEFFGKEKIDPGLFE